MVQQWRQCCASCFHLLIGSGVRVAQTVLRQLHSQWHCVQQQVGVHSTGPADLRFARLLAASGCPEVDPLAGGPSSGMAPPGASPVRACTVMATASSEIAASLAQRCNASSLALTSMLPRHCLDNEVHGGSLVAGMCCTCHDVLYVAMCPQAEHTSKPTGRLPGLARAAAA